MSLWRCRYAFIKNFISYTNMHKDEFCLNLENVIFNYLKKKYYF